MKKIITLIIILFVFSTAPVLAHPGKTDGNGCHTCRTDCEKWGLEYGEYHCHNDGDRFSDVMWLIEQIMWKSLDKRVASFLLEETSIEETNELKITHETIANHLGSHREVITRMLRYFQGEGLVKLSRGKITILDLKKLETLQRS